MAESNVYMVPDSTNNSALYSMMANGGMNGMWNSPFAYLMLLPFLYGLNGGGFGMSGGAAAGATADALSNQIQTLAGQVQDNHNSDLTMQAVNSVAGAVKDNGVALNAGFDTVSAGLCGIRSAVQEQGFANQLANCQQTNTILQQAQALQNSMSNGFTQIGFQLERNACDVKETSSANTQRIVDTLNNHWSTEAAATITQLRDELATINQTNALIAALGGTGAAKVSTT